MKKFLSLVLALVMAMSLVTVSAGAEDFTDDSNSFGISNVGVVAEVLGASADGDQRHGHNQSQCQCQELFHGD